MSISINQSYTRQQLVQTLSNRRKVYAAPGNGRVVSIGIVPFRTSVHWRDPRHRLVVLGNRRELGTIQTGPGATKIALGKPLSRFDDTILGTRQDSVYEKT